LTSAESKPELHLEIAHVLFMDVVGYSKLLINDQSEILEKLNRVVRDTSQFREADAAGKLLRLATGDGMALVFFNNAEAPVKCALEVAEALQTHPHIPLRIGVHSGPINPVSDVNDRSNVTGAGINMAQRIMDCGDAGHILVSRRVAEDLEQYRQWQPYLRDLGECEVKHGVRVHVFNLCTDKLGNRNVPTILKSSYARRDDLSKRRLVVVITALLLLGFAAGYWLINHRPTKSSGSSSAVTSITPSIPEKSIAVLPLENLSEEKENAFFADGIQDELLSNLAKIKDLKVISRTSVMQYKSGITRNLKEIAQQLGVTNVVEGSVRRSGNRVRVSVQLIDARTDRHIWAQNYDRTLADSLALQGDLATEIAAAVSATLSPQEKSRVEAKPTNNTAAYDAYLRGCALAGRLYQRSYTENAVQSYQEAVKLDPNFVLAWVRLSCAESLSYFKYDPSPARLAAARDAVDHARALNPNLPETHLALGYYRYYGQRDYAGALAEFQRAERGLPNNVDAITAIALIQRRLGHWEEAISGFRRVVELDPRNHDGYEDLAGTCRWLRRFPEALATVDRLLAWEPTDTIGLGRKASLFWAMGDLQAAESVLANPGTDPNDRGVQALFQRNYAAAVEIFLSGLAAKTELYELGEAELLLGLSQQRAGDIAAAHATYQKAAQNFQRELEKVAPGSLSEANGHAGLGVAYAGLGETASAVAEGQKAMSIDPTSENPASGPATEQKMAQIYALLGDADHAIPILKRLLQIPYAGAITPALLRLDPVWDQIRNDPRFQELAGEKKP
jgi:TolB-like protein/class 3 adenylate cyclase/Tfp pilus assembly protein PilF